MTELVLSDRDHRRFASKIDLGPTGEGCWEWTGGTGSTGYGQFWLQGRGVLAHRLAFALAHGRHPERWVLHSCDNPRCCNFQHLREGDAKDNAQDRVDRGRAARGERQHLARLTADDVRAMRELYAAGVGTPELGRRFGVHTATAHRVVTRKTWRHV